MYVRAVIRGDASAADKIQMKAMAMEAVCRDIFGRSGEVTATNRSQLMAVKLKTLTSIRLTAQWPFVAVSTNIHPVIVFKLIAPRASFVIRYVSYRPSK